ncbi:MAG: phosphate/phosphite/phosphonate ABC transporter substrate-binding protein [Cytophagales bacterium]|nr:phosphate/phosphite/phosphonate ABC transporter substrate-binding protein [Cytophagales bacterium]
MKKLFPHLCFVIISVLCCTCSSGKKDTERTTIKFYFTPSNDADQLIENSKKFIDYLQKETGYKIETAIPTNYITVIEAFGSKRADIAWMNSFGYILANEKYGANASLRIIRNGSTFYRGQIIANVASGINTLKDLNGKRFAYVDPASTSGYILPSKMLKDNNITPNNTVYGMKHDVVVTMVYQQQADAGATFYSPPRDGKIKDARERVLTQFPDVEKKVKIIALTDSIPNDPLVFRKDLPQEVVTKVRDAILKYSESEEGKQVYQTLYAIDGFIPTTDADYDYLRRTIKDIEFNLEDALK